MSPRSLQPRPYVRWLSGLAVVAIGAFAFLPICDLIFDCGCTWPGFGDSAHCDIHTAGPPDCPWCDHPRQGYAAFAFSAVSGLITAVFALRRFRWPAAIAIGSAGFFVAVLMAGVLTQALN